jgi:glycosyltransferase involved in cell wall biosynthesis
MKIAMLGVFPPFRGGIQHFNTHLYHQLKSDHEVRAINFHRQYPNLLFPGSNQYSTVSEELPDFQERVLDPLNPVTWLRAYRRLKLWSPDLVIFKYWMPFFAPTFGTITRLLRRYTNTRSLCIIDNLTPHEPRPGDLLLNRYMVTGTDMFICMSAIVEEDLLHLKPDAQFMRHPHPLYENFGERIPRETARERLGIGSEPLLLYFGFIRKYKGIGVLLDALPQVVEALGAKTIIAGESYEDKEHYRGKIESLGLASHIILADRFIPDEEVSLYFSAADVVVLPYLSATQSGIVSIALNYDLPCIVTDVGGLSEVVHHQKTGLLVPPNDPEALAREIVNYFKKTDHAAMAQHIAAEKQRYSWEAFTQTIFKLIAETPAR